MIDFAGWQDIPEQYQDRPSHEHNRLIKSSALNNEERRDTAREVAKRLAESTAPVHVILPNQGIEEWDRPGDVAHDPEGLAAFLDQMRISVKEPVQMTEIDAHINDQAFADAALKLFDGWLSDGTVKQQLA